MVRAYLKPESKSEDAVFEKFLDSPYIRESKFEFRSNAFMSP